MFMRGSRLVLVEKNIKFKASFSAFILSQTCLLKCGVGRVTFDHELVKERPTFLSGWWLE